MDSKPDLVSQYAALRLRMLLEHPDGREDLSSSLEALRLLDRMTPAERKRASGEARRVRRLARRSGDEE